MLVKNCMTFLLKYASFFLGASDDFLERHLILNLEAKEFELVVGELVISDFELDFGVFVENIAGFVKFFILFSPALSKSFFTSETLISV